MCAHSGLSRHTLAVNWRWTPVNHCCKPPTPPPRPCPEQGVLLPRVLGAGRVWLRRECFCLQVDGIPPQAAPPYCITSLTPAGEPVAEPLPDASPRHMRRHITLPLAVTLRDGCGCLHTGSARIAVEMCLTLHCPPHECWRAQPLYLPCVRLISGEASQDGCFRVQAEVLAEGYLLRWTPCRAAGQPPACPDVPLYPQPCTPADPCPPRCR